MSEEAKRLNERINLITGEVTKKMTETQQKIRDEMMLKYGALESVCHNQIFNFKNTFFNLLTMKTQNTNYGEIEKDLKKKLEERTRVQGEQLEALNKQIMVSIIRRNNKKIRNVDKTKQKDRFQKINEALAALEHHLELGNNKVDKIMNAEIQSRKLHEKGLLSKITEVEDKLNNYIRGLTKSVDDVKAGKENIKIPALDIDALRREMEVIASDKNKLSMEGLLKLEEKISSLQTDIFIILISHKYISQVILIYLRTKLESWMMFSLIWKKRKKKSGIKLRSKYRKIYLAIQELQEAFQKLQARGANFPENDHNSVNIRREVDECKVAIKKLAESVTTVKNVLEKKIADESKKFRYAPEMRTYSITANIPTVDEMVKQMLNHLKVSNNSYICSDHISLKELEPRTMSDSHKEFRIPLSSDTTIQNSYLSGANEHVRIGKLLEDLDRFAVYVCYSHNRETGKTLAEAGSLPRTIVTAGVDRIDMHSMEASMRIFQEDNRNDMVQILRARFIMVSRQPDDATKKVPVHPLRARIPDEAMIISAGEEANKERKRSKIVSLLTTYPSNEEMQFLHDIFLHGTKERSDGLYSFDLKWLHETRMEWCGICFREHQNMYGKIFGGFLMRQALELAYANAKLFSKGRVHTVSVDDISFQHPVELGNILHLICHITYTRGKYIQTRVTAEVTDTKTFHRRTTNIFHFTMEVNGEKNVSIFLFFYCFPLFLRNVKQVIPKYYADGMLHLSGKRHLEKSLQHVFD
uniref:HotDog ACOT-type domain-containing protein n=1 Tax=Heterorhabditis bacteriophora TaxID=37862 RepID=A0A1I7X3T3_HETBA